MPNLLSGETSPYLLQHASNPVDWFPWGPAALQAAREQGKPILLSIGYAACHWCHVMAHESFEDEATAAVMNAHFINIKVDREERPDLDQLYQDAHQLLTRKGGGWPLTIFLAPDGTPFHSGTYYPPEARYGRPAFPDLLASVAEAWQARRPEIDKQNASVRQALQQALPGVALAGQTGAGAALAALAGPVQDAARQWLAERHDAVNGGFGGAPKFPHPTDLRWLLERGVAEGDGGAREMALHSLAMMARGGVADQLGGGFFRYSVDDHWAIPHFEKMLSDNGQLLALYADATALTGEPLHGRTVEATVAWLLAEMQLPDGGFASSLDADSPGADDPEGAFYIWQADAVRAALSPVEWDLASAHWDLINAPNFEGRAWHLVEARPAAEMARTLQQPQAAIQTILDAARTKLLALREERPRPGRDDKVLGSWNALAVTGLVRAAQVAGRPDWVAAARQALGLISQALWVSEPGAPGGHRLLATCKGSEGGQAQRTAHLNAYLDDHAFLLEALLGLMQSDFRQAELDWATQLAEALLGAFEDSAQGGFFFTRHDHEALIVRAKPGQDHALPSGNAVAALALLRLGHLLGEPRYLQAAERTLLLFAPKAAHEPGAWSGLLRAALEQQHPPTLVVLRGAEAGAWRDQLLTAYLPHTLVIALPDEAGDLPEALDKPLPPAGQTEAWLCSGAQCSPPLGSLAAVKAELGLAPPATLH